MGRPASWAAGAALLAAPLLDVPEYYLHLAVLVLIWSFIYTGWSLMGRFGLVSLGHGAFMTVGAYGVALLWNKLGLTPWLGVPIALALAVALAVLVGYPCFRMRIVGHYFALVTLALTEVVRLTVVALRDQTGGSLGFTPDRAGDGASLWALQAADKEMFYIVALGFWALGIWIWKRVDRSMARHALDAISEDEDAAAAAGINVTAQKLRITVISAMMTAGGGIMYCQYQMYINPETVGGVGVSLQIVFAVIVGGMYVAYGPTVGAIITLLLAESLRVVVGTSLVGLDTTVYGLMLILFIIFLPQGILGAAMQWRERRSRRMELSAERA